ncbi:MAG: (2Fe-2S)-binding protein [Pseudomonadota bacterium]
MIVCQCNALSDREVRSAVSGILSDEPDRIVTPGTVVRALGLRRQCSGCLSALSDLVEDCCADCGRADCAKRCAPSTSEPQSVEPIQARRGRSDPAIDALSKEEIL